MTMPLDPQALEAAARAISPKSFDEFAQGKRNETLKWKIRMARIDAFEAVTAYLEAMEMLR